MSTRTMTIRASRFMGALCPYMKVAAGLPAATFKNPVRQRLLAGRDDAVVRQRARARVEGQGGVGRVEDHARLVRVEVTVARRARDRRVGEGEPEELGRSVAVAALEEVALLRATTEDRVDQLRVVELG